MRVIEVFSLLFLFAALGIGVYLLYTVYPFSVPVSESYVSNFSEGSDFGNLSGATNQFYSNMRYQDKIISYSIEGECTEKKLNSITESLSFLESATILRFVQKPVSGEITFYCSGLPPEQEDSRYFVAGEGGPSEIINTSVFSVIFAGKVSIYREEKCADPKISLHEILHALGFDHIRDKNSIMYPITECDQTVDSAIIEEINDLYSIPSEPDLLIQNLNVSKSGRVANFKVSVVNLGLRESGNSSLMVYSGDKLADSFNLGILEVGTTKVLSVENLRISSSDRMVFFVQEEAGHSEINAENNRVEVSLGG